MKYVKIFDIALKELRKLKKQEDRINNEFLLIALLIWHFSVKGKYLKNTLEMINEFDYQKNFEEVENESYK